MTKETESMEQDKVVEPPVTVAGNGNAPTGSLRDRIVNVMDRTSEMVSVPQWGVDVEVRSMTGEERAASMRKYLDADSGTIDYNALYPELIIATCYDPATGERIFGPEDVGLIAMKNAGALELLATVALRLSGLDEKARERAGKSS